MRTVLAGTVLVLIIPCTSFVATASWSQRGQSERTPVDAAHPGIWIGGPPPGTAKARTDTVYLLGGPGRLDGSFQDTHSDPAWHGWYGVDLTQITTSHWHIDTYNAAPLDPNVVPNHAYWCGECFENACGCGYGNNYNEYLDWYGAVPDPSAPTTVRVTARLQYDNEPGYDYLYLYVERASGMSQSLCHDGVSPPVLDVDLTTTVAAADYVGSAHDQIHLRWRAISDFAWSDEDCYWDTEGHTRLDNITVSFNGILQTSDDFESGPEAARWQVAYPTGVGNFAHIWRRLTDFDPCHENFTPQVAFIDGMDNGEWIVPGTGGTGGYTWTYGPGGYVVNWLGGLAGFAYHLDNEVWSPSLVWPGPDTDRAELALDVYEHLPLSELIFWDWHVRASSDGGTTWGPWRDRNLFYYSNAKRYRRFVEDISDLVSPGRTHVQVAIGAYEWGWVWGYPTPDTTPAPYFDNVAFKVWSAGGPSITALEINLAQDAFPAGGILDHTNLGANSVRFDMARNIAPREHLRNDPGDSIIADVVPLGLGSTLARPPGLHYALRRNPLFDPYRSAGLPDEGEVAGQPTYNHTGQLVPNRYSFDLPDTGFFYPGDVIHYFMRAEDSLGGVALLPADTSGFAAFPADAAFLPLRYPAPFIVRALPTMRSATQGDVPPVLWWNDFGTQGGEDEWCTSLSQLGYREGIDFDTYYTNGPSSGVGNGLGGRATAAQLAGYRTLLYTAGDLGGFTLSNGDFARDPSRDLQVLDAWLRQGGKHALLTGDDLVFDVWYHSGSEGESFRTTWLGLTYSGNDVRLLIDNQSSPLVVPMEGSSAGLTVAHTAYGGCPIIADFDAVTASGTGERILRYCDPSGTPAYTYAAGILNRVATFDADIITLPYDLMRVHTAPGDGHALPARTRLLGEILAFFGEAGTSPPTDVPDGLSVLDMNAYPNPFNPRVKLEYVLPRAGHLWIKVYDVRGALVRTLLDEWATAGLGTVVWDGDDARGRATASGVYFCALKAHGEELIQRLVLVR